MSGGEHMPDKQQFVEELFRVTAPGGRIIVVTWCHRELTEGEMSLSAAELSLLDNINAAFYLPAWYVLELAFEFYKLRFFLPQSTIS